MVKSLLFLIVGIVAVLWGADRFTDGAGALARRMNVPQIVIGLTIVAFGTSMPELCISLMSALKGSAGLAVGNIVGSNIFNALAIVGCAALVAPISVRKSTVQKDIPFAVGSSVLLTCILLICGGLPRTGGALLLLGFVLFMIYTMRLARKGQSEPEDSARDKEYSVVKCGLFILIGLACLVVGSHVFVDGATDVAVRLHVSESVIGLTIVACGTSLPELATSVVAARKGQSGIAIGNVIGSNVFNVLMILGITGLICPLPAMGVTVTDLAVFVGSILLLWLMSFTKYRIERWEGAVLVVLFLIYIVWLVLKA